MHRYILSFLAALLWASSAWAQNSLPHSSVNPPLPIPAGGDALQPTVSWTSANPGDVANWLKTYLSAIGAAAQDLTNVVLPAALSGTVSGGQAVSIQNTTGPTAIAGNFLYGALINAQQLTASANGDAAYVGLAMTGTGRATGSEGGFKTTLASPASATDTTLTLTSTAGFVDGLTFAVVLDKGVQVNVTETGAPIGGVVTLAGQLGGAASAGNLVYRYEGFVKGGISEGTMAAGSAGMYLGSFEASVSAQAGSDPYLKSILGATANSDDVVGAESLYDSGLFFSAQSGAVGYKVGVSFDPRSGKNLVGPTGTLIKSFSGGYATGIDFSTSAFTGLVINTPGFTTNSAGQVTAHGANTAQFIRQNDGVSITAGGLWRDILSGGSLIFQINTAAGGDFSSVVNPITFTSTGETLTNNGGIQIQQRDTSTSITAGGLWRNIVSGGALTFQVNTAAGGDFSTAINPLALSSTGATTLSNATIKMPGLASSSAATTGTVCWTTGTGILTVDTTTTCLLSSRRFKEDIEPLDIERSLREVLDLKPVSFRYKPDMKIPGKQLGLIAEDVAEIEPRLVRYDAKGKPAAVKYQEAVALLVGAIRAQQKEIDELKAH